MANQSQERRIKNEQQFRDINEQLKKATERMIQAREAGYVLIDFYCECSDKTCEERLKLTSDAFESLHGNELQFIIKPGHEHPDIERVIASYPHYVVVEKMEHLVKDS